MINYEIMYFEYYCIECEGMVLFDDEGYCTGCGNRADIVAIDIEEWDF